MLVPSTEPEPAGDVELQIVRTLPAGAYRKVRKGDYSILESYIGALNSAEHIVYLESQFLWSPEIVDILVGQARGSSDRRLPGGRAPSGPGERRRRHLAWTGCGSDRRRRRRRSLPRLHGVRTRGQAARHRLRALEDRDRRRPLADGRLGQSQRALAHSRHRDEHRHARRDDRARHPAPALVGTSRAGREARSRGTPLPSSTGSGGRSLPSSSTASRRGSR